MPEKKKQQEKKKDGAQGKRIRPQGWLEVRQVSRSVRRLARVLRHNGEDAAKSFAVKYLLDGVLNRILRSPEYQRFRQAKSRRALTYRERRAQKRAAKLHASQREAARLAAEQSAAAAAQAVESSPAEPVTTNEVEPEKPAKRRRNAAAKPKAKAIAKPKVIAIRGRVRPDPEKVTKKASRKED